MAVLPMSPAEQIRVKNDDPNLLWRWSTPMLDNTVERFVWMVEYITPFMGGVRWYADFFTILGFKRFFVGIKWSLLFSFY